MNVDLHTHTQPASDCSRISRAEYVDWCVQLGVEGVALTNHGDTGDNRALEATLAAEGILLIHGVEISTLFGDFVIFSPDLDFLDTFNDVQGYPRAEDIPDHAAVVWVHPAAGGGRSGSIFYPGIERMVADSIHGVEVYNGTWAADRFVNAAEAIAGQLGLARTGGSDAHDVGQLMCCYTEIMAPVSSTADVVRALRDRLTIPHRLVVPRKRRFGIF